MLTKYAYIYIYMNLTSQATQLSKEIYSLYKQGENDHNNYLVLVYSLLILTIAISYAITTANYC